jgi:threonine/homoserine/homoserine lactone efflux protein
MIEQLPAFLVASVLLTLSPGPDIIYVLVQGMTNGKKYGLVTTMGLVSGLIIHTSLVAFGISALIKESDTLFMSVRVLGAVYLFYLAWQVYRSDSAIDLPAAGPEQQKQLLSLYKKGFLMNVLNPKVAIFFLAFFPGFLWEPGENSMLQIFILGFVFMLQALAIFSTVAIFAGKVSKYLKDHPQSGVVFKVVQVTVFIGIGIFILL